ncbi:MAG TPA: hypothetical protein DHV93_08315 [Holophagaceae bacterium]|nr:hypothetical protein [Holophagaceae bacterium]
MQWKQFYALVALNYAFYIMGRKDERGHTGWKNTLAAICMGFAWPVAFGYGIYLKHFRKP